MRSRRRLFQKLGLLIVLLGAAACGNREDEAADIVPPTPTSEAIPTEGAVFVSDRDYVVIATDAPNPNFSDFDPFGNVIGFNNDVMARLAALAGFDYEFVVTPHEGVLNTIAAQSNRDFDAVMSSLVIPEEAPEGVAYSDPYLEVGQVLVVLADERTMQSYRDLQPSMLVGAETNSSGTKTAQDVMGIAEGNLIEFASAIELIQGLIDGAVDTIILDSYAAEHFTQAFPEQLRIVGGEGRSSWISSKGYGIAVAADNTALLERLNDALAQAHQDLTIERLTVAWLIPEGNINAGESRIPTPASELIVGVVGQLSSMDPATDPDFISWEVKINTMSGLYAVDSQNQLVPMLATGPPLISKDQLEYTFELHRGLRFPDSKELTAEDVKWAINRAAGMGSFLINDYLKDSDEDNFADEDSVAILDQYTVKLILQEPTAHFLSIVATPPYFPISSDCFQETLDLGSTCGGIGPYTIVSLEPDRLMLKANPEWPGQPAPAFENIHVRFYEEPESMIRSLVDFQSIDVAWTGLPYGDYADLSNVDADEDGTLDYTAWEGPAVFKSYLIFEQDTAPWDKRNVRQAVAYALDRPALASEVFAGERTPLYSPVPAGTPGSVAVLPERSVEQARALLLAEGYSETNPLTITIWYTDDAHYTPLEESYAAAIKAQLEETNVFQVELQSAPWEIYRPQIGQCNYPAYLMGWPTPGRPTNFMDVTSWTEFFVENTGTGFCSNYESAAMATLLESAATELNPAVRVQLYASLQTLWAEELPTLDLTQEARHAISLNKVGNLRIDALGLLHYEVLTKGGG